tara:strand:- start:147 stop:584 length:438 start_codon:yes stop_codon:yes gene_type:complete
MIDNVKVHLKNAMVNKDKNRITALRNIIAKLKAKEIEKKENLSETESLKVLQSMGKQLKESISQFTKGNRKDLADKEQEELDILNEFLPTPLSEAEMSIIIDEVINSTNATSMSDMGKVMGMSIAKMEGRGDGTIISKIVKDKLS